MVLKKLIPVAKVSAETTQDLVNSMRIDSEENLDKATEETPADSTVNTEEKKLGLTPQSVLSVDPDVERMRNLLSGGKEVLIDSDGTALDSTVNTAEKKSKLAPEGVLSTDPDVERMRELLAANKEAVINSDGTISSLDEVKAKDENDTDLKTVPKTVVSSESPGGTINELLGEMRGETGGESCQLAPEEVEKPENNKFVPKAVVSANVQWYERNKDLLKMELAAMHDFKPDARYGFKKSDGKMYWLVNIRPKIFKDDSKNRKYTLMLIYDEDHPKARYGSSVKAIPISPSLEEMQKIVNSIPAIKDKRIPHILRDSSNGELYLCSADTSNCKDDLNNGGITSAATSLRFAMRWINVFELAIHDPERSWPDFQKHGVF